MSVGPGRERQAEIYGEGVYGRRPRIPTDFAALEKAARRKASVRGWAYVAGGAGDGATMRANRAAFERWAIVPRVLRDVEDRDLSVELFGRRIPAPVLFAPVGASELLHPQADVAIAGAAADLGLPYIFSSQSCFSMEECAAVMGDAPRWFQLYWSRDEGVVDSFLQRAKACGCEAIVVTLDTTMLGWRPQDLNLGSLPFSRGEGIAQYVSDPRFRELVRERLAAGITGRAAQRPDARRDRRADHDDPQVPGLVRPERPLTRAARRGRDLPGHLLAPLAHLGRHRHAAADEPTSRSCSRASCTPTTPAERSKPAWTASSSPTTAAARSTAPSPRSTPSRTSRPPSTAASSSCSTAASAAAPTSSRRSRSAPTPCWSAARTSTASRSAAATAPETPSRTSSPSSTSRSA